MSSRRWSETQMGPQVYNNRQESAFETTSNLQDKIREVVLWINHTLAFGGYPDDAVNDLCSDLRNGTVLIKLLHSITGEQMRYHSSPTSVNQKLDNVKAGLSFISQRGGEGSISGISPEDIVRGNLKAILALCHSIRKGLPVKVNPMGATGSSLHWKRTQDPLLLWAGETIHREIMDYSEFRNGRYLCEVVNALHNGAISPSVLSATSPPQKCLSSALHAAETCLGMSVGPFDIIQVAKGENDNAIQLFLQQLKDFKLQKEAKKRSRELLNNTLHSINGRSEHSWVLGFDESCQSQRPLLDRFGNHSMSHYSSASPRVSQDLAQTRMISGSHQQVFRHEERTKQSSPRQMRVSYSTDHLNSTNSGANLSLAGSKNSKTSDGKSSKKKPRPRPVSLTEPASVIESRLIQRQGDTHSRNTQQLLPHSDSSGGLSRSTDRGGGSGTDRSVPRYSLPNSNTTVEFSYSNDIPIPVAIYRTSSRTSIHSTSSRSSIERNSTDDHLTLAHVSKLYSTPIPPHMMPPDSQSETSIGERNNNGWEGAPVVPLEQLTRGIDDLNTRVRELSLLMIEEKDDIMQNLFKTVARERSKREQLEKRYKDFFRVSKLAMQRYESCLVHLGKEISRMSSELNTVRQQLSMVESVQLRFNSVDAELTSLREKVELVQQSCQSLQQPPQPQDVLSYPIQDIKGSTGNVSEKGKKSIFSRKRS